MSCLVLFPLGRIIIDLAHGHDVGTALSSVLNHKSPLENLFFNQNVPAGPIWYLRCIILWRIASWMMYAVPGWLQLLVSFVAGTLVVMSDGYLNPTFEFQLTRTATMAPFFFVGRVIDWQRVASAVPEPSNLLFAISWLVLFGYVALYEAFTESFDTFFMAVETWVSPFVRCCKHNKTYSMHGLKFSGNPEQFQHYCWARYWVDLLFRGVQGMLFFLFCVPRGRVFFTTAGTRSIYPYLLHNIAIILIPFPHVFATALSPYGNWRKMAISAILQLAFFLCCGILTVILATDTCRASFGWALEPTWLMNIWTRGARFVDGSSGTKT